MGDVIFFPDEDLKQQDFLFSGGRLFKIENKMVLALVTFTFLLFFQDHFGWRTWIRCDLRPEISLKTFRQLGRKPAKMNRKPAKLVISVTLCLKAWRRETHIEDFSTPILPPCKQTLRNALAQRTLVDWLIDDWFYVEHYLSCFVEKLINYFFYYTKCTLFCTIVCTKVV